MLFHRLAKGLAASHHAGVVHRDLKPSNVMAVGGEHLRDVKITDFGIAKMAEEEIAEAVEGGDASLTASQTAIGALPYMAPELIESMKSGTFAVDIWSIGAMLFELLTGAKPFGSGLKAVASIMEGKVPPLPTALLASPQFKTTASAVYDLVKKCLQVDPVKRPSADQLVAECEGLCYPIAPREFGAIKTMKHKNFGFASSDEGSDVFCHVDSVFGGGGLTAGDRIWFARHEGGGADRAFPIVRVLTGK